MIELRANPFIQTREIKHTPDPQVRFYEELREWVAPTEIVIHTDSRTDQIARSAFDGRMSELTQMDWKVNDVGLWIADERGIYNSDFFTMIGDSDRHGLIALSFRPPQCDEVRDPRLEIETVERLGELGYRQSDASSFATLPGDDFPLARGLFMHEDMLA